MDYVACARKSELDGQFSDSLRYWQQHQENEGFQRDNVVGFGRALRELGRYVAAETVLSAAVQLYPDDLEIEVNAALNAGGAGDWMLSCKRWDNILKHYPSHPVFDGMAAVAFACLGDYKRGQEILLRAMEIHPASIDLHVTAAIVAEQGERWKDAVQQWDVVLRHKPADAAIERRRAGALLNMKEQQLARGEALDDNFAAAKEPTLLGLEAENSDVKRMVSLLDRFESLGADCEFGLLQRHYGLEPASLLRFSRSERLIDLLDEKLEPLDDLSHVELILDGDEYAVKDNRGYFWTHSFIYKGQMEEGLLLKRQKARIKVLKRKLLNQLETGDRVFVYKEVGWSLTDDKLKEISASLRRFGPNRLLGFRLADKNNPSGSVVDIDDWIQVAYVGWLYSPQNLE